MQYPVYNQQSKVIKVLYKVTIEILCIFNFHYLLIFSHVVRKQFVYYSELDVARRTVYVIRH